MNRIINSVINFFKEYPVVAIVCTVLVLAALIVVFGLLLGNR